MTGRKKIPESTKLQLWVKSAGRCEFKGCNNPVWYNGLTLSAGNFAEVAHIIGSSSKGPRGTKDSEKLQIDFSNLMLLCKNCHTEVDNDSEKYSTEILRRWKKEHEDRIEIQTSHPEDIHKSKVLTMSINIGDRSVPINIESARNAMFPKYPADRKGIKIEESDFNRTGNSEYWQTFAESKIKRKVLKEIEEGVDEIKVKHLSVFAIGPMPLLIYLGKCLGDTIPTDIYQSSRNIENTNTTWSWVENSKTNPNPEYLISCEQEGKSDVVLLKLALSDILNSDKYPQMISDNCSIYQITTTEPSPQFLKSKKQLEAFSYEYRKILNKIQDKHGANCKIFILPAIPVSIAIECGRAILPSKDPEIYACEYYNNQGFKSILRIN